MSTRPGVAIFDMDGTLTRSDMFLAYLKFVLARRKHRLAHCTKLPFSVLQFQFRFRTRGWLKQEFTRAVLAGCSENQIETWTREFVDRYGASQLKPAGAEALHWHRTEGHRLIIASASLDIYVRTLATSWKVPEVICTTLERQSGKLTGRLSGPNLRGDAKLTALKQVLGIPRGEKPEVFAYSDDHSDLPLLRFADHGFAVDPTRKLAAIAPQERLKVLYWNDATGKEDLALTNASPLHHARRVAEL